MPTAPFPSRRAPVRLLICSLHRFGALLATVALAIAMFRDDAMSQIVTTPAAPPETRPNVLLILIDDMNDWVGYMNQHSNAHTPNMDRLAAKSVAFTNAHCPAPICKPSRIAMMTGLYPNETGAYDNHDRGIVDGIAPFTSTFLDSGYDVMVGGKIFHGPIERKEEFKAFLSELDAVATRKIQSSSSPRIMDGTLAKRLTSRNGRSGKTARGCPS